MAEYSRPAEGYRFKFGGIKTNSQPDSMPEHKFPFALNIRAYKDSSVESRPQVAVTQAAPASNAGPVLSLEPALGVYKIGTNLFYLGSQIDTGYSGGGASIIPFRPNASPNAWEYVWDDLKSTKVNLIAAPLVQKVGIAEPQAAVDAVIYSRDQTQVSLGAYAAGGTAAATGTGARVTDSVVAVFPDPSHPGGALKTLQVNASSAIQYQRFQTITINAHPEVIEDVFVPSTTTLGISGIYYFTGNTGRCVVVPAGNLGSPGVPGTPFPSLYSASALSGLRRGALVQIGAEVCYVLGVIVGPDGTTCFETITIGTHTTSDSMQLLPAIQILSSNTIAGGNGITSPTVTSAITTGIGTLTTTILTNPFGTGGVYQDQDYLHLSLNVDLPGNIIEIKFLIDVGDGTFTKEYFYYTIRPNDIQAGLGNTLTQLGVAQLVVQRAAIDMALDQEIENQGDTSSSDQLATGNSQWTEILFPISALTRVGNDQTKSLQTADQIQIIVNCIGNVNVAWNSISVLGGFQPDVGDAGLPYMYWARPRSSVTGAKGNPCPINRYGVTARRHSVAVTLPVTYPDPQMDTWDIYRQGGALESPTFVGYETLGAGFFLDNFGDDALAENDTLEYTNLEPFPSIGPPITTNTVVITGNIAVVTFPTAVLAPTSFGTLNQLGNLLPGNLVNIALQAYTLWNRPTLIPTTGTTQTWLFRFVENVGVVSGVQVQIYEPNLANQSNPFVWGPDANGVFFSVGDPLRPGVVSHTEPQNPDSCRTAVDDLCAPTEPLQNGVLLDGTSVVFSPSRAWAGYPGQDSSGLLKYRWVEIPVGSGLAAPFGICTDGKSIFYVAKNGINKCSIGPATSLTDADLYNLFPHEGLFPPVPITYAGQTISPPEYIFASLFRLNVVNNWLYFDYVDANSIPHTLVMNVDTGAWCLDQNSDAATIHVGTTGPITVSRITGVKQQLFLGAASGAIYNEISTPDPTGEQVGWVICTKEEMMGDIRARKIFGDASLDLLAAGGNVVATPVFLGTPYSPSTTIAGGQANRSDPPAVINLAGEQIKRSMGMMVAGTDQGANTRLYAWQPSYIPQPEDIQNRFGDWDNAGSIGAKFWQGFILEADTNNLPKQLAVRSSDDGLIKQTFTITHNGQQQKAYSFAAPFVAHLVREEPDAVSWRKFKLIWVTQPTPESVLQWITQATSHGLPGYQHVHHMMFAYNAPASVTFTITVDGVATPYTLPATTGYTKKQIVFSPIKGLVFQYSAVSTSPFQVWTEDIEIFVKPWGSSGPYMKFDKIGGLLGNEARI